MTLFDRKEPRHFNLLALFDVQASWPSNNYIFSSTNFANSELQKADWNSLTFGIAGLQHVVGQHSGLLFQPPRSRFSDGSLFRTCNPATRMMASLDTATHAEPPTRGRSGRSQRRTWRSLLETLKPRTRSLAMTFLFLITPVPR